MSHSPMRRCCLTIKPCCSRACLAVRVLRYKLEKGLRAVYPAGENFLPLIHDNTSKILLFKVHIVAPVLAPSGALVFIMVYYIPIAAPTFPNFSNLEQSCLYTSITHFHFQSVFNIQNRTRKYFFMNNIDNACMSKFIQDSERFFRFL